MSTRLTTIVAIDVDKYSALAAADAGAAVAAVARLRERCAAAADAHGGRIFSQSGDSVLMEFENVTGALHAADDLAHNPDPPIRIGIHLGEVSQLPNGDLLGSGVAIAGKLQENARAGGVLVSQAVRSAVRGPLARRLTPKGSIKIQKEDEQTRIYELAGERTENPQQRSRRLAIAGVATVGAVILLALIAWPLLSADPPARAAVLPLAAPNEDALQGLANGVAEDISSALDAQRRNPIARASAPTGERDEQLRQARAAGAPFAIDGSVERMASLVRITLNLSRTADGVTLWSEPFEATVNDGPALRHRAAITGADVLTCALDATRKRRDTPDDATMTLLLRACAQARDTDRLFETRETLSQVAARAPNLGVAQAMLAATHARAREAASNAQRDQLRTEARETAERALRRDNKLGDAYLALDMVERPRGWDAREGVLLRGLEHDESHADLNARYGGFLLQVGRVDDALARARNASTLDPLAIDKRYAIADALLLTGDLDAARDIADAQERAWPGDPNLWALRFRLALWSSAAGDAAILLGAPDSQVRSERTRSCWLEAIAAARTTEGSPARSASLRRVLDCSRSGDLPASHALMLLSELGSIDEAFALARTHFVDEGRGGEEVLFAAATRPMRLDARFMPLMKDLGILGYWRLSGHWADFCREPSLPYRCQAEAQRLL